MKRLCSFVVCCFLVFQMFMPISSYASTNDNIGLDKVVEIVKNTLNIKIDEYEFNNSYSQDASGKNICILSWNSKNNLNSNINVTVDANSLDILSINQCIVSNKKYSKIPKYTRDEALKAAQEVIQKLLPEKANQLVLKQSTDDAAKKYDFSSEVYIFKFVRYFNGIEYDDNGVDISINKNNLNVTNYSFTWDYTNFPDIRKAINLNDAKQIFANKIGLQLRYYSIYRYDLQSEKSALVYTLKDSNKPIDAVTGDVIFEDNDNLLFKDSVYYSINNKFKDYAMPQVNNLIPIAGNYMYGVNASEILGKALNLKNKYTMTDALLYRLNKNDNPTWYLKLTLNDDSNKAYGYVTGEVDAVTGMIKSFKIDENNNKKSTKLPYTKDQCRRIAEDFIKQLQPERSLEVVYEDDKSNTISDSNSEFVLNFTRKINNVLFPYDGISIGINANTGKVTGYNINWSNINSSIIGNFMSLDDAYKSLFNNIKFCLKYIKTKNLKSGQYEVKLAYVLDNFSGILDAKTGAVLDYNCDVVQLSSGVSFVDIQGNPAEEDINLLSEMDIIDNNFPMYMPNDKILQKDFIKIIMKTFEDYNYSVSQNNSDGETGDNYDLYYNQAIQRKIISSNEKSPYAVVTKEEAAKMLIRALGLGYIAELDNSSTLNFKDADQINAQYKGYVFMAEKLNIFRSNDECFYPKNALTRGEAASLIVNYLKVDPEVKE